MAGDGSLHLRRADLPAMCRSAADASGIGQRRTKRLVRVELVTLVLAGVAGLQSVRVGPAHLDVAAALAGLLFVASLATLAYRGWSKPEDQWYLGRAGAESLRTLAWRYAVGGDPFPTVLAPDDAAQSFLDRLQDVLGQLHELSLAQAAAGEHEITDVMRRIRAADLATRRGVYLRDRIDNQITWYVRSAGRHAKAARIWLIVSAAASVVGVLVAIGRMIGLVDLDLLGVAAAVASAAIAWNQLNQNRTLVSAYRLTASELRIIRDRVEHVDDAGWAAFVSDAEDAVSREHTMWLARHGHPGVRVT